MKTPCKIRIKGIHINLSTEDAVFSVFEDKKSEITSAVRTKFDLAETDGDFEEVRRMIEDITPEHLVYPETEFIALGTIEKDKDAVRFGFTDEFGHLGNVNSRVVFSVLPEGVLSLTKSGTENTSLIFQNGKRIQYDYNRDANTSVTLFTRSLTFEEFGDEITVHLDYFIDVGAVSFEHNVFTITAEAIQ